MILLWIIIFSLLGSIGAIAGASLLLIFPDGVRKTLVPFLISYATGTLLGAAFLGMIPHALEHAQASRILPTVLAGIILFFLLEKLILWRHCHNVECDIHGTAGPLVLLGDAFHNIVDGVVIAAAFLTSIPLGAGNYCKGSYSLYPCPFCREFNLHCSCGSDSNTSQKSRIHGQYQTVCSFAGRSGDYCILPPRIRRTTLVDDRPALEEKNRQAVMKNPLYNMSERNRINSNLSM